ncbi:MAG TPA: OmpA family protein [Desulfopila sp.]|nr:OmpA family protein [Desulfopila sp.]
MAADGAAGSEDRGEAAGETTIVIEASDVLFDFDKYVIKKIYYPVLDEWVLFFQENPHIIAQIFGHTDSIGPDAYNQKLSERRARAVFNYLVDNGIDKTRLKTRGFGESLPIAPNTTPEGRQKNRRVEVNY